VDMVSILFFSFIAGIVTGLGALISIIFKKPSEKIMSWSLGFAAGIMIGISTLSLIPESFAAGWTWTCVLGVVLGAFCLWLVDELLPHQHKTDQPEKDFTKVGTFIAIGIAFHNLPEGIAIGASSEVSAKLGLYTAISIGIHNIAEGLSVAMPLRMGKMRRRRIVIVTTLTGMTTLIGAIIGLQLVSISPAFISISLAFAAGAMLYIASDELIPISHRVHSHSANMGMLMGILLALLIK